MNEHEKLLARLDQVSAKLDISSIILLQANDTANIFTEAAAAIRSFQAQDKQLMREYAEIREQLEAERNRALQPTESAAIERMKQ